VTAANVTFEFRPSDAPSVVRARPAGMLHDVFAIAGRALRAVPRDLEAIIPPIFIAIFFFIVNVGTLENLTQNNIRGFNYTAFEMATAVLLGVTGVSRAQALVVDVQSGYFDRLLLTPVRRLATPPVPMPFSPDLERSVLPSAEAVAAAAQALKEEG
jgi:ABC-2 type transport system permease protein